MSKEDRRSAPRFAVSLKGTIATADDYISAIEVSNISSSGLQFIVAQAELPCIIPNISETNSLTPVKIELNFNLPESKKSIKISCGIVYIKIISIDQCRMGCRFEKFYRQSDLDLEEFIGHCTSYFEPLQIT